MEAVDAATKRTENAYICQALKRENGRVAKAAKLLGISRRTLQRKINQLGIDKWDFRDSNHLRKS